MLSPYPWQESQWRQVVTAATRGKLPHALLLTGPEGTGLGYFAACLAARFLCMQPPEQGVSCGNCKTCILFQSGNHPDLLTIRPEEQGKQIRIERIREMIDFIYLCSHYGRHKIVIIDSANAMNRFSANTLLKTLEEPPPTSLILLASHQPSLLPVTVRSRCQRIKFSPGNDEQVLQWLREQSADKATDYEGLLALAEGGPLKLLELFEEGKESIPGKLLEDLKEVRSGSVDPVQMAEKWQGLGAVDVLHWLLLSFGRIARLKLTPARDNTDNSSIFGYLQYLADHLDLQQAVDCYDLALKNYHAATGPIALNRQGLLEDIIIYWRNLK